jgi:hypothetical protein
VACILVDQRHTLIAHSTTPKDEAADGASVRRREGVHMQIQIELARPRWLRLPRRWRTRVLASLAVAVVVAVPAAWASHTFADVPTDNPHHADVTAIRNAGITMGCSPGPPALYCPSDGVRRDQMASFMRRGFGQANQKTTKESFTFGHGTHTTVLTLPITVPGAGSGATQFVKLDATMTVQTALAGTHPPFGFLYYISENPCGVIEGGQLSPNFGGTIRSDSYRDTVSASWVRAAPPGPRTFRLCAHTTAPNTTALIVTESLIATTYPFGSQG